MARLDSKVMVVTGATSGIGQACARRFAEEGARVVIAGRREDLGAALAAELGEQHWRGKVVAVLRRAVGRADLPPDADVELIVDFWAGVISYRRTFRRDALGAVFREMLLDLVLSGMVPLREPVSPGPRPADAPLRQT